MRNLFILFMCTLAYCPHASPIVYAGKVSQFSNQLRSIKSYVNSRTDACFEVRENAKKIYNRLLKMRAKDVGSTMYYKIKTVRYEFYQVKEYIGTTCYWLKNYRPKVKFYIPNMLSSCLYCLGAGQCGSGSYAFQKYKRCSEWRSYTQDNLNHFNRYMPTFQKYANQFNNALNKLRKIFGK